MFYRMNILMSIQFLENNPNVLVTPHVAGVTLEGIKERKSIKEYWKKYENIK